jgi:predicted AlkP superfamily pyrophosphatase or phosphodiesterase
LLPDYGGACISSLYPALASRDSSEVPGWLPVPCLGARQVVLLVLDGIGWRQLRKAGDAAPTLSSGQGGHITSVVPTTTATALTSITTGQVPARHGVVGYRLRAPAELAGGVLNVLRWRAEGSDVRRTLPARRFQPLDPFGGGQVSAVTRSEFASTGFTALHLSGVRMAGWSVPSTMVVELRSLLRAGEPFVYAYYDGLDKVAHAYGLGDHYAQEIRAADRLVADIVEVLPSGSALVVTSDHGQVDVSDAARLPHPAIFDHVEMLSGEGRFRWLHALPGAAEDLLDVATEAHGEEAWVVPKEQMVSEGWFGGPLSEEVSARLGDVAIVAREAVAFLDPADTGETRLAARHGSLTADEMNVPLLAWSAQ